jgi:hypothetical protein
MKIERRMLKEISGCLSDMMCDYDESSYDYITAKRLREEVNVILEKTEKKG